MPRLHPARSSLNSAGLLLQPGEVRAWRRCGHLHRNGDTEGHPSGRASGDGVQNILPWVIGMNRFRYWQLMGQKITAQQAYAWGAVNEVLPKDKLLDRACARRAGARPELDIMAGSRATG
jgi:Enoyl-CoA hydratase/isomerase